MIFLLCINFNLLFFYISKKAMDMVIGWILLKPLPLHQNSKVVMRVEGYNLYSNIPCKLNILSWFHTAIKHFFKICLKWLARQDFDMGGSDTILKSLIQHQTPELSRGLRILILYPNRSKVQTEMLNI